MDELINLTPIIGIISIGILIISIISICIARKLYIKEMMRTKPKPKHIK